jgi:hypothetical protein
MPQYVEPATQCQNRPIAYSSSYSTSHHAATHVRQQWALTGNSHFRFTSFKAGIRYAIVEALGAAQPAPDYEVDQRVSW